MEDIRGQIQSYKISQIQTEGTGLHKNTINNVQKQKKFKYWKTQYDWRWGKKKYEISNKQYEISNKFKVIHIFKTWQKLRFYKIGKDEF